MTFLFIPWLSSIFNLKIPTLYIDLHNLALLHIIFPNTHTHTNVCVHTLFSNFTQLPAVLKDVVSLCLSPSCTVSSSQSISSVQFSSVTQLCPTLPEHLFTSKQTTDITYSKTNSLTTHEGLSQHWIKVPPQCYHSFLYKPSHMFTLCFFYKCIILHKQSEKRR